jgi:hypothetical protein
MHNKFLDRMEREGKTPKVGFVKFRSGLSEKEGRAFRDGYAAIAARKIQWLMDHLRGRPTNGVRRAVIATAPDGSETHYESISATRCHGHIPRDIHYCLAGTQKKHHKLKWRYADTVGRERPVERIGFACYPSMSEAERQTGIPRQEIRRYIDTVTRDPADFHWKWAEV